MEKIVSIKTSMNRGLSLDLREAFPNVRPVLRPDVKLQETIEPYWLSGFASGDGCFLIKNQNISSYKTRVKIGLKFQITQHSRDDQLMKSLVSYLGCGRYEARSPHSVAVATAGDYVVTRFSDHIEKIIPFFDQYPILGVKGLDYADFKKVAEIMKTGGHLTQEGLEEIRKIKEGMNRGRES